MANNRQDGDLIRMLFVLGIGIALGLATSPVLVGLVIASARP